MHIYFDAKKTVRGFREWIAWKLVTLAKFIYPQSEDVMSFHMTMLYDYIMYGQAAVRVSPEEIVRIAADKDWICSKKI